MLIIFTSFANLEEMVLRDNLRLPRPFADLVENTALRRRLKTLSVVCNQNSRWDRFGVEPVK